MPGESDVPGVPDESDESDERDQSDERERLPAMNHTTHTHASSRAESQPLDAALGARNEESDDERRVALAWTDPEEGGTLWIELWGSAAFVAELVDGGFELRDEARADDARADEVLDLRYLSDPAQRTGAHLRARILESEPREL